MNYLTQLTPAESLLVLQGNQAQLRDQLKFTLMDLFFKNVLQTQEIEKHVGKYKEVVTNNYVVAGKNFNTYRPQAHEMVFLGPYAKSPRIKIIFRHLVKMGFENAGSSPQFYKLLIVGKTAPFFSYNFFQRLFGGKSYTQQGKDARAALRKEIAYLENDLISTQYDPGKVQRLIGMIYGNICLTSVKMEMIQTIDKTLGEEMAHTGAIDSSGWSSCGSWSSFNHGHHSGCGSSCSSDSHSSGCGNSGCSSSGCSSSGCSSGCGGGSGD